MLRHSNAFWFTCAFGVILSGCASTNNNNQTPVAANFDQYYGQPKTTNANSLTNYNSQKSDFANNYQNQANGIIELNPNAPKRYTVKKGDTLWDIAGIFLKHPWRWPEIWDKNQNIKNPHLIYPGDTIYLNRYGIGINKPSQSRSKSHYASGERRVQPSIRIERTGDITQKPLSTLAAFTMQPRVMSEAEIKRSPYLVASRDRSMLITKDEKVYIKGMRYPTVGQRCAIYHPEKELRDPETNRLLGYEVNYVGYARIDQPNTITGATIIDSKREIHSGDRLLEQEDHTIELNVPISAPTQKVRGSIVSLSGAERVSGNYMIAVINRGQQQGIRLGHTLGVYDKGVIVTDPHAYRKGKLGEELSTNVHLPPEKVANMVIFKVDKNLSYGLIMNASREVKNGYKIGNP